MDLMHTNVFCVEIYTMKHIKYIFVLQKRRIIVWWNFILGPLIIIETQTKLINIFYKCRISNVKYLNLMRGICFFFQVAGAPNIYYSSTCARYFRETRKFIYKYYLRCQVRKSCKKRTFKQHRERHLGLGNKAARQEPQHVLTAFPQVLLPSLWWWFGFQGLPVPCRLSWYTLFLGNARQ